MRLLAVSHDAKTVKGEAFGLLTAILYMLPATRVNHAIRAKLGVKSTCPFATSGCKASCLNSAGRGGMASVQTGRSRKLGELEHCWEQFWADLRHDVAALVRKAEREGLRPAVRLNGTSDLPWERCEEFWALCAEFPTVQFYDYTKWPLSQRDKLPTNYELTYSRSEDSPWTTIRAALRRSRVAIVFRNSVPTEWHGIPVVNGDSHDAIFIRPRGVILGLTAKGRAKHDSTGFVIDVA